MNILSGQTSEAFLTETFISLEGETIAESTEESVQRVTEFYTAFINTTYLLEDRGVLHTDRYVIHATRCVLHIERCVLHADRCLLCNNWYILPIIS